MPFLSFLSGFSLSCLLESLECLIPEPGKPALQRLQAMRVHRVQPPVSLGAIGHESRRLQDLEVLRNRGAADIHPLRDFSYRPGATANALEHGSSSRVPQGIEDLRYVSLH
jgi:hypothetical protein